MPRPSRRAATNTADAWLRLPQNVQTGFLRLVQDNEDKVRNFLTTESREDTPPVKLCELCAGMMRQQKLSAAGFLTRFFDKDSLAIHAALVGKSPKGQSVLCVCLCVRRVWGHCGRMSRSSEWVQGLNPPHPRGLSAPAPAPAASFPSLISCPTKALL
jgi:hypothetical protein